MGYQYKVVELREKMIGGKLSGERLEKVLNEHASQGWQLKSITTADVKGRGSWWGRGPAHHLRAESLRSVSVMGCANRCR